MTRESHDSTSAQTASTSSRVQTASISNARVREFPADFDLLASCYDHPDACDILNMDGLQKLRLTLQRLRKQASPEQRALWGRYGL